MKTKNQHEWGYMGTDLKEQRGDLMFCELCNRWAWSLNAKKYFKLSQEKYEAMHRSGEIDASCAFNPL